ncbi:MAG: hypothetical protein ACI8XC_002760 [Gammaproteobacteria bacterium]|jgi:hypothetical protein
MKLKQRQFLKGSTEFEIIDDVVEIRMKSLLKEEKITVLLPMLDPEPVINKPFLEFHSRVKCGPLLSLMLDKPNSQAFNAFVNHLKLRAREEYNAFAGLKAGSKPEGLAGNVYTEPPEFDEPSKNRTDKIRKPANVESLDIAIQMIDQYLDVEEVKPLIAVLKSLKAEPENELHFAQLVNEFDNLGPQQGAVLTYAPYVGLLLADDPLGF